MIFSSMSHGSLVGNYATSPSSQAADLQTTQRGFPDMANAAFSEAQADDFFPASRWKSAIPISFCRHHRRAGPPAPGKSS